MMRLILTISLALLGCTGLVMDAVGPNGEINPGPGGDGGTPLPPGSGGDPTCSECGPGAPSVGQGLVRLTHAQWERSVQSLLGWSEPPNLSGAFASDPPGTTQFNNDTSVMSVTQGLWANYQTAAEAVADRVGKSSADIARIRGTDGNNLEAIYTRLLASAFRRPATAQEISEYTALHQSAATLYTDRGAFEAGISLSLQAILQAGSFLYRAEIGEVQNGARILTATELASKLSYTLWNSPPDTALFDAAVNGQLSTNEQIAAQVRRMLDDPRAQDKVLDFHTQLYLMDKVLTTDIGTENAALREPMHEEARRFVENTVLADNGSLMDLLTSKRTYVNGPLAGLYGVSGVTGNTFQEVVLTDAARGGLFTQPWFLASQGGFTGIIHRGVFLNTRVICADLPEPLPIGQLNFVGTTRRQRIDSITGPGTCGASCHGKSINPPGYALENFDDLGRWRTTENGAAIDATGTYTWNDGERSFTNSTEFLAQLADNQQTHSCYARNWMEYLVARPFQAGDQPVVAAMARDSRQNNVSIKEMLVTALTSVAFRTRLDGGN